MTGLWIALAVAGVLLLIAIALGLARRLVGRDRRLADAAITNLRDATGVDEHTGAVRSVQAADLLLSEQALRELWSPMNLERLGRTYWRFLTRVTLGLIRVRYGERERSLLLLCPPLRLISFRAPEYELNADHGVVRWRIESGLLVSRTGTRGTGHLQIDVRRYPGAGPAQARLHVEVEVANFYPAIAFGVSRWLYNATQSRIHVIVTHGFLRSLVRLELAESRVGLLAEPRAASALEQPPPGR
jgi:hypothetical protein